MPWDLIWHSLCLHSAPEEYVSSNVPLACSNHSRSPSACTRALPSPRFCSPFALTWPQWIFRCLSPGHFYSLTISSKLTKCFVGLHVKCKIRASRWTCTDCTSTSRSTWSAGPRNVRNEDVRMQMGTAPTVDKIREGTSSEAAMIQWENCLNLSPPGRRLRCQPKKRWLKRLAEDMHSVYIPDHDFMPNLVSEISALK